MQLQCEWKEKDAWRSSRLLFLLICAWRSAGLYIRLSDLFSKSSVLSHSSVPKGILYRSETRLDAHKGLNKNIYLLSDTTIKHSFCRISRIENISKKRGEDLRNVCMILVKQEEAWSPRKLINDSVVWSGPMQSGLYYSNDSHNVFYSSCTTVTIFYSLGNWLKLLVAVRWEGKA